MRTALILAISLASSSVFAGEWLYLTRPGDTLISISQQYLKNPNDWPKLQKLNSLADPRHMPANTRIKIPTELLKTTPAPVKVTAISGNARYKSGDGPYQTLTVGAELTGGETVLTGPGGSVGYRFADGTSLTQQASSKLGFSKLTAFGPTGMVSTELSLDSGRLEAHAAKQLAPAGGFQVRTPVAVAGLRGTGFRLNVSEDGKALRNEVLEGAVAVAAQGQEVRVEGGFGTLAEQNKPPIPPRALLPRPDLAGLSNKLEQPPFSFNWKGLPAAHAWRAQIAADTRFQTVLLDGLFGAPSAHWDTALPDGQYVLRVRAVDELGLEGLDAAHPFTLTTRPPLAAAPVLSSPADEARIQQADVSLVWKSASQASTYQVQLSASPDFTQPALDQRTANLVLDVRPPASGRWYWRVASLDAKMTAGEFAKPRILDYQPLPAAPVGVMTKKVGDSIEARWQGQAVRYRVELARDAGFSQIVAKQETAQTSTTLARLDNGDYWLRVTGLNTEGAAGAASAPQPVSLSVPLPWWLPLLVIPGL